MTTANLLRALDLDVAMGNTAGSHAPADYTTAELLDTARNHMEDDDAHIAWYAVDAIVSELRRRKDANPHLFAYYGVARRIQVVIACKAGGHTVPLETLTYQPN